MTSTITRIQPIAILFLSAHAYVLKCEPVLNSKVWTRIFKVPVGDLSPLDRFPSSPRIRCLIFNCIPAYFLRNGWQSASLLLKMISRKLCCIWVVVGLISELACGLPTLLYYKEKLLTFMSDTEPHDMQSVQFVFCVRHSNWVKRIPRDY